jgi:hypothetical protein
MAASPSVGKDLTLALSPLLSSPPITPEQVRWHRMQRSGLVESFATPEAAASALFGVQAQILPAAALALWNRTRGLTEAQFNDLLFSKRTLVKLWGQRGTLHLYASTDWPLLHGARSVNRTWWERQLAGDDLTRHEALIEQLVTLLRERETIGRSDLRTAGLELQDEHFSAWGGVFADLVRRGHACHAGRVGNEGHFAHRERWLPDLDWQPPDSHRANVEVMRCFLAAYGPATLQDFAYWRSVTSAQARSWLESLEAMTVHVTMNDRPMLLLAEDLNSLLTTPPEPEAWPVRMLYRFDPCLLAHKEKDWVVDPAYYKRIWRPAGHIEGIVLAHGQALATWRYDRKGRGLLITIAPFKKLPRYVRSAIDKTAPQVAAFFASPLTELVIENPNVGK